jgi:hypothetical protein
MIQILKYAVNLKILDQTSKKFYFKKITVTSNKFINKYKVKRELFKTLSREGKLTKIV